jgi:putative hemolysin
MRVLLVVTCALLLASCGGGQGPAGNGSEVANPASAFCEEQDGTVEIRTAEDGSQRGVCVFADGSECDEWAFYRGECQPGTADETDVSVQVFLSNEDLGDPCGAVFPVTREVDGSRWRPQRDESRIGSEEAAMSTTIGRAPAMSPGGAR